MFLLLSHISSSLTSALPKCTDILILSHYIMKTLDVISLGLQFSVALLTADLYTVAHDYNLHKWNSYLWVQIVKQLTGARLSTMPIYCSLCHLKENCSPCFKEYVLSLNWSQILKVNKIFCSFSFYAHLYTKEMLVTGICWGSL